jgi:hypothetical protein
MVDDFVYYDDDGNLVYADPSDFQKIPEKDNEFFDDFELFRKKIDANKSEHYDELIFIDKLEKIITQHPFVDVRSYLHDYMSGLSSFKLMKKYQLFSKLENYRISSKYLGFPGKRETQHDDNLSHNLKNDVWNMKHGILLKSFSYFKVELDDLIYYNLLRGFFILYLTENPTIQFQLKNSDDLKNYCVNHHDQINLFVTTTSFKNNFLDFLQDSLKNKLKIILNELTIKQIILTTDNKNYQIKPELMNIKKLLVDLLMSYEQGITHGSFNYKLINKFPEFRLIPNDLIWNLILSPLEINETVVRKPTQAWMARPYTDMIFTKENFESTMKFLRNELQQFGKLKFFGRRITADKFIHELIELKKGNYDDLDDQVTRLAGLCLADSVLTTSPHEELNDFDFSINVSDYRFRPEQIEAMKKSNFVLTSPILHCKVMIHEKLDVTLLEYLNDLVPSGHQGIIFSFTPQNSLVKEFLEKNLKIQIIDEDGIRSWVDITSSIPCRVGAVAKIRFDPINDNQGKIARIDSINYETGMSAVTILPELDQSNIHIRSLEEIILKDKSSAEFTTFSRNYFEFLKFLSQISDPDEFSIAIFELVPDIILEENGLWRMNFGDITTKIFTNRAITDKNCFCSCINFSDDNTLLCKHLISSFNKIMIDEDVLKISFRANNIIYEIIMNFIANLTYEQISSLTDFLEFDFSPFFKTFLQNMVDSKNH